MPVTINGSTGIGSPGGDTSASLSTGLLTVTGSTVPANGMYLPATNTLAWTTNSTRNMTLDASGNFYPNGNATQALGGASNRWSVVYGSVFSDGSTSNSVLIDTSGTTARLSPGSVWTVQTFYTGGSERARITSGGALFVGCTTTPSSTVSGTAITGGLPNRTSTGTYTGAGNHWEFYNGNGAVGYIQTSGSTTTYSTSSDQRLKENILDASSAIDSINSIKVRSFDWKADGSHVDYGYIAQELLEVAPEAVSVPADPDEMMGVDFGKLTPRIIKALQELTQRLEALEAK